MGRVRVPCVPMQLILLSCLLRKTFHFYGVDYLLKSAAIVEQCDGEQEKAKAIEATDDPVESGEPSIFFLGVSSFARE